MAMKDTVVKVIFSL